MLTPSQIADLAAHAGAGGIARLLIEAPGCNLQLEFQPGTDSKSPADPQALPALETVPVRAAGFGAFLPAHPLACAPFVKPGDAVRGGDILGLLRSGLILRPVRAPSTGTLDAALVEPGALTGYGQEVLRIRIPEDAND